MYFHPARPPGTDKPRISITRWQNSPSYPKHSSNRFQDGKDAKATAAAPAAARTGQTPGSRGHESCPAVWLQWLDPLAKKQQQTLGRNSVFRHRCRFGWGGWPGPNSPGEHCWGARPPESARCCRLKAWLHRRCQMHTFRCHESSVPQVASGDLLSSALAVLPVPRTITHSAPQYISHCISCLIWQQN